MAVLSVYVDDDTMRRLRVAAICLGRPVDELAECAVTEAAMQAVPCMNGVPLSAEHRAAWPAFTGSDPV